MLDMLNSSLLDITFFLSNLSPITIIAGIVCILGLFAWLITRWTECTLVWTISAGYALIPFLPHARG